MNNLPTALYRHFNDKNDLLYVGISKNPFMRIESHHSNQSHWMREVNNISIKWYKNRKLAKHAEDVAIKKEKPIHNILGNELRKSSVVIVSSEVKKYSKRSSTISLLLDRKVKKIIDDINAFSENPKQLIVDILFMYGKNRDLFDIHYKNTEKNKVSRRVVILPFSGDIYCHLKTIEYGGNDLERIVEVLFMMYADNGYEVLEELRPIKIIA